MRIQALKKASREREMKMQKQSELLRAKKELEALKNKHQKLSDRVQKYSIFSKYLEDVVKASHVSLAMKKIAHGFRGVGGLPLASDLKEIRHSQGNHSSCQTQRPQMGWEEVACKGELLFQGCLGTPPCTAHTPETPAGPCPRPGGSVQAVAGVLCVLSEH